MTNPPFQELQQLEAIIEQLGDRAQVDVIERIDYKGQQFPIHRIRLGSSKPDVPVLAYFGGVHGLEKIGSEVLLSYLTTIIQLLDWDQEFNARLQHARLVFVPLVNPVGVYRGTRSNGNGVDLMRNAPIDGVGKTKLYSGQRITSRLPWFRGDTSAMEKEAQALCRVVNEELFNAPLSIAVDLHSGFGIHDRLWFPYAGNAEPLPTLAETYAWKTLFDRCYPHHFYKIEPMSQEYVISGDLWDYLYDDFMQNADGQRLFLPLTLEMGSWMWLRKSPLHLFQRHGLFHPLAPHRQQRILRRHFTLFDFLFRSLLYPQRWAQLSAADKAHCRQAGLDFWYG